MEECEKVALDALDPGFDDPAFWARFQSRVMKAAMPELARRKWSRELTVSQVVLSWSRMLVPMSAAAAVAAGFMLMQPDAAPVNPQLDAIEELLVAEADDLPFLKADRPPDAAEFIVAVERR